MNKEIWKDIKGYEGLYRISSHGNVYSESTNRLIKITEIKDRKGNPFRNGINLCKNNKVSRFSLHILMYKNFIGDIKGVLDFKDGDFRNKKLSNLIDKRYTNNQAKYKNRMVTDGITGKIYPSIKDLAEELGVTLASVRIGMNKGFPKYKRYSFFK